MSLKGLSVPALWMGPSSASVIPLWAGSSSHLARSDLIEFWAVGKSYRGTWDVAVWAPCSWLTLPEGTVIFLSLLGVRSWLSGKSSFLEPLWSPKDKPSLLDTPWSQTVCTGQHIKVSTHKHLQAQLKCLGPSSLVKHRTHHGGWKVFVNYCPQLSDLIYWSQRLTSKYRPQGILFYGSS